MADRQQKMAQDLEEYIKQVRKIVMGSRGENEEFENLRYDIQNMILTHALKLQENSTLRNINDTFSRTRFH